MYNNPELEINRRGGTSICPQCKGRRVVFDPMSLLLTVALPITLIVEHGEDKGITKKDCPTCHGNGFIRF